MDFDHNIVVLGLLAYENSILKSRIREFDSKHHGIDSSM